jgi:hypothetical protein
MANTYLSPNVLDGGLDYLTAQATDLHICSQPPGNFAAVGSYTLGSKAGPTVSAAGARTGGGRQVTISAITDGTVTATDVAGFWAIVDTAGSELLAAGILATAAWVGSGNPFALTAFHIGFPNPA